MNKSPAALALHLILAHAETVEAMGLHDHLSYPSSIGRQVLSSCSEPFALSYHSLQVTPPLEALASP